MSKYTINYERADELGTFVTEVKAKTDEEAREKFEKQYPSCTVVDINKK